VRQDAAACKSRDIEIWAANELPRFGTKKLRVTGRWRENAFTGERGRFERFGPRFALRAAANR
jgi:hypothetical protein